MKIGIIIVVRMDSHRLPGKALKKIKGKEIIKYVYERVQQTIVDNEDIIFATSDKKSDEPIKKFCKNNSYKCFRGSKDNVADRLLKCAKKYKFNVFIRICGDNVFADKDIINNMIGIYKQNNYDVVTNTPGRTFPYGISVEIIKTNFYEKIYSKINDPSDREHVTKYIYRNIKKFNVHTFKSNNKKYKDVKLALDTKKDFEIIKKIIKKFKGDHRDYNIDDIVDFYHSIVSEK